MPAQNELIQVGFHVTASESAFTEAASNDMKSVSVTAAPSLMVTPRPGFAYTYGYPRAEAKKDVVFSVKTEKVGGNAQFRFSGQKVTVALELPMAISRWDVVAGDEVVSFQNIPVTFTATIPNEVIGLLEANDMAALVRCLQAVLGYSSSALALNTLDGFRPIN